MACLALYQAPIQVKDGEADSTENGFANASRPPGTCPIPSPGAAKHVLKDVDIIFYMGTPDLDRNVLQKSPFEFFDKSRKFTFVWSPNVSGDLAELGKERENLMNRRNCLLSSPFYWFSRKIRKEIYKIDDRLGELTAAFRAAHGGYQRDQELKQLFEESESLLARGREMFGTTNGSTKT